MQITDTQLNAALRHVYTVGGTVFTLLATFALIPQEQVQPALNALHQIGDGLKQVFGGVSALWVIIGPVIIGLAGKGAVSAATFKNQLKSVTNGAAADESKKVALADATANVPGIAKVEAAPEIANATPNPKVTPVEIKP